MAFPTGDLIGGLFPYSLFPQQLRDDKGNLVSTIRPSYINTGQSLAEIWPWRDAVWDTRVSFRLYAMFLHGWGNYYEFKLVDATNRINELYGMYTDTADALAGANNEIAQRDITIGDLVTQIGDFTTQIGSLTTLINSLSTENTETREQRDEAIAQRDGLQGQLGELQAQHDELQAQRDELQGQYNTALGELGDARDELRVIEGQLGDVQDTVDKAGSAWAADNPDLADKGLDFKTFIDLTDAFASEDPERIGSAISTLEGMGINPADIKGETFTHKFEGEDEKEYIPTDPPEIPDPFDDEEEREKFNEEVKKFFEDEEAKLELYNKFDRVNELEKDPYATPEDKESAWGDFIKKAGPFGSLIGGLASVASPLIKFFQPGEDETPGGETPSGEPIADSIFPKIKIPGPDLGLKLPSFESLVDFSSGKRGLTPEYTEPPAPDTFLTGVQPGEEIPKFELKYEDEYVGGLFAKKEDKEGIQYPFPFGKDELKYPETALL